MQDSVLFPGFYGEIGKIEHYNASFPEFARKLPILYGQIMFNGNCKIGSFRPSWNKYTNSKTYNYFTPEGNRGKGGFTLMRAWNLLKSGGLSLDPKYGHPDTYL
jgi:hypothetical protein